MNSYIYTKTESYFSDLDIVEYNLDQFSEKIIKYVINEDFSEINITTQKSLTSEKELELQLLIDGIIDSKIIEEDLLNSDNSIILEDGVCLDFQRDETNTTVLVDDGRYFPVNVLQAYLVDDGTISIRTHSDTGVVIYENIHHDNVKINGEIQKINREGVVDSLNSLFSVSPRGFSGTNATIPVLDGVDCTLNFLDGQDPIGTPIYGPLDNTLNLHGARVWSTETINEAGESFLVNVTGVGGFGIGIYSSEDVDITSPGVSFSDGYFWGIGFRKNGTRNILQNSIGSNNGVVWGPGKTSSDNDIRFDKSSYVFDKFQNNDPVTFKIAFDDSGFVVLYYYNGNEFVYIARSNFTVPSGNYGLLVKLTRQNSTLYDTPTIQLIDGSAPTLSYRYIESPDGSFYYPLFSTKEESDYVDQSNGGSGDSDPRIFIDDPTLYTWYMPKTGSIIKGKSAPEETFYTEIPTLEDNIFAPESFNIPDLEVNEETSINYQVSPLDVEYSTSIEGLPKGLYISSDGRYITGSSPSVDNDYIINPYDQYVISVTRTNNYGSTSDTFILKVFNTTAPITAVDGFTHISNSVPLVDSLTLDEGSAVSIDETLSGPYRFIFDQNWVEFNILSSLRESGDIIYVGILESGGDLTVSGSGASDSDFKAFMKWEYVEDGHISSIGVNGSVTDSITVNSSMSSIYDYAFEADDHGDLYVIACNLRNLMIEPGLDYGGSFARTAETIGTDPFIINISTVNTQMNLDSEGMLKIVIPIAENWIQVTEDVEGVLKFDEGDLPTLNAGYTYRFLMSDTKWEDQTTVTGLESNDILRFTSDGVSEYTVGINRSGAVGDPLSYVEFTVPEDVPPLWYYIDGVGISQENFVTISGSTYTQGVTGASHVLGTTDLLNNDLQDGSFIELNETLDQGKRIIFNKDFINNIIIPNLNESSDYIWVGVPSDTFDSSFIFFSDFWMSFRFTYISSTYTSVYIGYKGTSGTSYFSNLIRNADLQEMAFAFELSEGNLTSIIGDNDDVSTISLLDWNDIIREQPSSISGDVSVYIGSENTTIPDPSLSVQNDIVEIISPEPSAKLLTTWNKAVRFTGGNSYMEQVTTSDTYQPLENTGNASGSVSSGFTSTTGQPWATSCVYRRDNHSENQYIWVYHEGTSGNNDRLGLALNADGALRFDIGRDGSLIQWNQTTPFNQTEWIGLYIDYNGYKTGTSNGWGTVSDIASRYRIRRVNLSTGLLTEIPGTWSESGSYRDDRNLSGFMCLGGRRNNRSFKGKMASMIVSTLNINSTLPTDTEISYMTRDPNKWITRYKLGEDYRSPTSTSSLRSNFSKNSVFYSGASTQVWIMGDGSNDGYAVIRNQVYPGDQNYTACRMNNMTSSDIVTISINGLNG